MLMAYDRFYLYVAAINTGIGAVLAVSIAVADVIYLQNSSIWYTDPVVGIICAAIMLIYGTW